MLAYCLSFGQVYLAHEPLVSRQIPSSPLGWYHELTPALQIAQETFNRWRAFIWLPLLAQGEPRTVPSPPATCPVAKLTLAATECAGYFISLSSLQAFLLCLDDLQLYSMPRLTSWAWNVAALVLAVGGVVTGAMMADRGTQLCVRPLLRLAERIAPY
jgi:hypothetical protein